MYRISESKFERMVQDALDTLPDRVLDEMDNVAVVVQDEPDDDQLDLSEYGTAGEDGDLLGLYDGISLVERDGSYGEGGADFPDVITVFKGPHERIVNTRAQLAEEVRKTIVHEVGHYFGLDEDQVAQMGYE